MAEKQQQDKAGNQLPRVSSPPAMPSLQSGGGDGWHGRCSSPLPPTSSVRGLLSSRSREGRNLNGTERPLPLGHTETSKVGT